MELTEEKEEKTFPRIMLLTWINGATYPKEKSKAIERDFSQKPVWK